MGDDALPKPGDVIADKYVVESVLGEGGMGAVFAATHKITGKRVALKWMHKELARDQEASQRFIREAQAAGRIDHPNVVDVYDVGQHGETVFLVMEYLYGEPLTALVSRGQLDSVTAIRHMMPALRGVAAAHRRGVVHRDIKPDNIFLCRSPEGRPREAKVLDFGISKVSSNDTSLSPRLTRTGAVMGTPYYMSPEQVRGAKEVGSKVDVYAFGVILYEALTGQVPFNAETFSALVLEIATGTPKPLMEIRPDLPPELEAVVMKAMAREPEERYQDIESFARALEPFGDGIAFDGDRADPTGGFRLATGPTVTSMTATSTPFASEAPVTVPGKKEFSVGIAAGLGAIAVLGGLGAWFFMGQAPADEGDINQLQPAAVASPTGPSEPNQLKPAAPAPEKAQPQAEQAAKAVTGAPDDSAAKAKAKAEAEAAAAKAKAEAEAEKKAEEARKKAEAEKKKRASRSTKPRKPRSSRRSTRTSTATAPATAAPAPPKPAAPRPVAPRRPAGRSRTGGLDITDF